MVFLLRSSIRRDDQGTAYLSAQATQAFITLMDAIRLDQRAVDDVKPLIYSTL